MLLEPMLLDIMFICPFKVYVHELGKILRKENFDNVQT